MESAPNELGRNLRRERERNGLTQDAMAALAGVSRNFIASVEIGRIVNPGVFTLYRVARALDVALETLLGTANATRAGQGGYTLADGQRELEARLALSGRAPYEPWTREDFRLYMPGVDYDEIATATELVVAHHLPESAGQTPEWIAQSFYAAGVMAMALVVENSDGN